MSPRKRPTADYAAFIVVVITTSVTVGACPIDCHCDPYKLSSSQLKLTCVWPSLPSSASDAFSSVTGFEAAKTSHLTIQCYGASQSSKLSLVDDLFAALPALTSLRLTNCLRSTRLTSGSFRAVRTSLRTLRIESTTNVETGALVNIEAGAFAQLTALENLHLTGIGIRSLPAGELCTLGELKTLNLSRNRLESIENIGLHDCKDGAVANNVILLDLSANRLTTLDRDSLSEFQNLHVLYANENLLTTIPKEALRGAAKLQELHLAHNRISLFQEDLRENLPQIASVDLSYNRLEFVPATLTTSTTLLRLNLSHNSLDAVAQNHLHLAAGLETLDLSHNEFAHISAQLLANLTSLQSLYLHNNAIEKIEQSAFASLARLRRLDLSANRLDELRREHLDGLHALQSLIVRNNSIASVEDDCFAPTLQLRDLDVTANELIELPSSLTLLYHLSRLDASANHIANVHKFLLDKLPNLVSLDLSANELVAVERYTFENLPKLESLNLASNAIAKLAAACFDRNPALSELRLDANRIRSVQGAFSNVPALTLLNLTANELTHIDFSMLPTSLRTLLASHNALQKFTNYLRDARQVPLEDIDVAYNQLTTLVAEAVPNSLVRLNASHNLLREIDARVFFIKANLSVVDFRSNRLELLNQSAVALDDSIQRLSAATLYLADNPLRCSCALDWLKSTENSPQSASHQSLPVIVDYADLYCEIETPGAFSTRHSSSRLISTVPRTQFLCAYEALCADQCPCCDYENCDCNNVCPTGCTCYRDSGSSVNIVLCTGATEQLSPRTLPMYATKISLDGVRLPRLTQHAFLGRYRLKELYLNGSGVRAIDPKTFTGLTSLEVLDLSDNDITELRGDEFFNLPKLTHLFLNGNRLARVYDRAFTNLPSLRVLTMHANRLRLLPDALVSLSTSPALRTITIADNQWACDCASANDRYKLQTWLPAHLSIVRDHQSVVCFENLTEVALANSSVHATILSVLPPATDNTVKVNFWTFVTEINATFCTKTSGASQASSHESSIDQSILPPLVADEGQRQLNELNSTIVAIVVGMLCACAVVFALVLFAVWVCRRCQKGRGGQHPSYMTTPSINGSQGSAASPPIPLLQYDAFISYSAVDEDFVMNEIANELEGHPPYYQLCLMHRNLSALPEHSSFHQMIADEMMREMERAQRIIMVVTPNFLKREWELAHIRTAHQYVLRDKQKRPLIVVVRLADGEDSSQLERIDPILGHYIRTSTCVRWGDPLFWAQLHEAMPDRVSSPLNRTVSSEIYGTIVPSDFV